MLNDEINQTTEITVFYGIRLKLIYVTMIIGWLMVSGLIIMSFLRPNLFSPELWTTVVLTVLVMLVSTVLPWKSLLKVEKGLAVSFIITLQLIVLLSAANYLFHSNRIFPFVLVVIFSAIFYDKQRYIASVAVTIAGLIISMMASFAEAMDVLVVEVCGILIFSFLCYWMTSAYKKELSTSYKKSQTLAQKVDQLDHINRASLILKSQVHLNEFIDSLIKVARDLTQAGEVIYVSVEDREYAYYFKEKKIALGQEFEKGDLMKLIINGSSRSLPAEYLKDLPNIMIDSDEFFLSLVEYQEHVYGALILIGGNYSQDKSLLDTVSNHAAVGMFKRHILKRVEDAKKILEEKDKTKQELLRQIMTVQEDERKRIARELHDEIGQTLNSLLISLEMTYKKADDQQIKDNLEILINECQGSIYEIDRIIWSLRPIILDDLGLVPAIRSLARRFSERTGLEIGIDMLNNCNLDENVETVFYRFTQETLNNIIKHSKATKALIKLIQSDDRIEMVISDNGSGFEKAPSEIGMLDSMGIQGIIERLSMFGGELSIITDSDGASLKAMIPLKKSEIRGCDIEQQVSANE